jgi:hypothetical protein
VTRVGASERSRGDASDIDGQTDRSNGAFGKSDIERKTARVAASDCGQGASFKWAGAHESAWAANEFQPSVTMRRSTWRFLPHPLGCGLSGNSEKRLDKMRESRNKL